MAALPFLTKKGEDEESSLKRWLGYSFYIVTVGLLCLNVSGAWIGSKGNLFYAGAIAGAELFVAMALGALIYTRNNLRFGVGIVVFLVGVYITLENGKMAVTHSMDDVFTGTPTELREKADLADKVALSLEGDATTAKTGAATNLTAVRNEIAELRAEQRTLAGSDIYGIQRILQANGLYSQATLDGVRGEETERGIVARGEAIRTRLDVLAELERMATAPPPAPVVAPTDAPAAMTPAEAKRAEAIEFRKQAVEVEERTVWLHILLIGLEGIRSLALWVFLMDGTMSASRLRKGAYDQLKLAEINVEIAAVNARIAALQATAATPVVPPPPVSASDPPEMVLSEPLEAPPAAAEPEVAPAVELTPAQRRGRAGGKAAAQYRAADKAKSERLILVGDWEARDADLLASKVAAE